MAHSGLRKDVRAALRGRDQAALVRAMSRHRDASEASAIAQEELERMDPMTLSWWAEEEPNCDGVNCGHDHALVVEGVRGYLEGR